MNAPPGRKIQKARTRLENKREREAVGNHAGFQEADEEADGVERGGGCKGVEAGIPSENLGFGGCMLEEETGVSENRVWGEGAEGGDFREREIGYGSVGFDELGVDLLKV